MARTPHEQFTEFLSSAKNVLILIPEHPDKDTLSAALALAAICDHQQTSCTVITDQDGDIVRTLSFLPQPRTISKTLNGARDFILSFDTTRTKITNVRTERTDHAVRVVITPEHGAIDPRDFSFVPAQFRFDRVIVLGAHDKDSLGAVARENPDIFYDVPVLNVDIHPSNENFGQINLVDVTASSVCESLAHLLITRETPFLSAPVATCFLTGIIAATDSFQGPKTTPRALSLSSTLIEHGADRQLIVRHLYKSQPLSVLKLWGRIMAHLKWHEESRVAWSTVSVDDFIQSRAASNVLPDIMERLRHNFGAMRALIILYPEKRGVVRALADLGRGANDLSALLSPYSPVTAGSFTTWLIDAPSLEDAERRVVTLLTTTDASQPSSPQKETIPRRDMTIR